ncbi:hypothetical protein SAMN05518672_10173 [Chitinophaga sp. CF118]|uniref:hypothetical protein n=1 Tax=Chitinophaga sp. CF118 TaxID=1884367 RepID=UPI0008ED503F|nr:hypothetical protein [Chitinophaga sp. CF118]SFD02053.1 hypothetical protein SAMN05518672_10173 [Chitinophaga sp. CF118]
MKKNPCLLSVIVALTVTVSSCSKNEAELTIKDASTKATINSEVAVTGNVTYTLVRSANPTSTEQAAYALITAAMDTAVYYMNAYTTFTKSITVTYVPSVATADGNINGSIRFGSNTYYMNAATALHEVAHTVGVGTSSIWWNTLIVSGIYTGANATQILRTITGDSTVQIHGDSQHFWPYGFNYPSEFSSYRDYIYHCQILEGMNQDGL